MKLLLTSGGISNKLIEKSLESLADKPLKELNVAFIPTASHWEEGDKSWLITDLVICLKIFKSVDIVDISILPKKKWKNRLDVADVIFIEGGNTGFLSYWVYKSEFNVYLEEIFSQKIYVGVSAGSMIMGKNILLNYSKLLYGEATEKWMNERSISVLNFSIVPHYKSNYFTNINDANLQKIAKDTGEMIYALDDNSVIKVVDEKIEIVSEGKWKKFE
ncbi:MAG: Type 1 glutamine amidotransferase-like domain-containing protein [Candidatus Moranbacteria bacterium]|nr:Type 1 glutamine amidotransferase-like domain-containing protein [Candidatus Moranbacteria bacterium]